MMRRRAKCEFSRAVFTDHAKWIQSIQPWRYTATHSYSKYKPHVATPPVQCKYLRHLNQVSMTQQLAQFSSFRFKFLFKKKSETDNQSTVTHAKAKGDHCLARSPPRLMLSNDQILTSHSLLCLLWCYRCFVLYISTVLHVCICAFELCLMK